MRKPASFLDDLSLSEEDERQINYADPLCCPGDPLDEVLRYIPLLDDKILEALGIDCSLPPSPADLLGAEQDVCRLRNMESAGAAAHMVISSDQYSTASAASSYCSLSSSTSWEPESPERASRFRYWDVPKRPRRQQVAVRKRAWSHPFLDFPSTPVAAAADQHGFHNNNADAGAFSHGNSTKLGKFGPDNDESNFSKLGKLSLSNNESNFSNLVHRDDIHRDGIGKFSSGNCGGGHRRSAGRQRDRLKKDTICSHCRTTETPQWRAGPDGPGTLCNACGIRYRMGGDKLVPEYLPSTSPFFRSGEHSNRHSKVEKLREKKVKAFNVSFGAMDALTPTKSGGHVDTSLL